MVSDRGWINQLARSGRATLIALMAATVVAADRATAEPFSTAAISAIRPEWSSALEQFRSEIDGVPEARDVFAFDAGLRTDGQTVRAPALDQLNALTGITFTGIRRSAVPVLLPLDTPAFFRTYIEMPQALPPAAPHLNGFRAAMFSGGPAGYDAVFTLDPGSGPPRAFKRPVEVHVTGSALLYDIHDPLAGRGSTPKALTEFYPDLRRVIREGFVRYAFTRFGVPYVVSIQCLDSAPRARRLACREASAIAEKFLIALRVSGGMPAAANHDSMPFAVQRPAMLSADFTYRPPGEILPNTGYRNQPGHADLTVYSRIRFPLEEAPAFANSQSFLHWGDCFQRGRVPYPRRKGAPYRCRGSDKPLVFDESARENYSYPWQDNFCEARDFGVGQCASGLGHQGQDIRPATCALRNEGADRCQPDRYAVLAVRDGVLLRSAQAQAMTLLVNERGEHIRFRYMHMNPSHMDADGMLNGRRVSEGEKLGLLSNYQDHPGGTTAHLHFDVQVFTRDGWLWVNPYVTLIASYEHLLGARGREVSPDGSGVPDVAAAHAPHPDGTPAGTADHTDDHAGPLQHD